MIFIIILMNVLLLIYVLRKNKEGQLFKKKKRYLICILFGVIAFVLSLIIEWVFQFILSLVFSNYYKIVDDKLVWTSLVAQLIYYFIDCFLIIAIVEELAKFLPLFLVIENNYWERKTKFDCILPFLIVTITCSIIEDIIYIYVYDLSSSTGILRLLTEFSGHTLWGLISGIGYYKYTVKTKAESIKYGIKKLKGEDNPNYNFINTGMFSDTILIIHIVIATILHGLFDFLVVNNFVVILIIFSVICTIYCIQRIVKLKNSDILLESIIQYKRYDLDVTEEMIKEVLN